MIAMLYWIRLDTLQKRTLNIWLQRRSSSRQFRSQLNCAAQGSWEFAFRMCSGNFNPKKPVNGLVVMARVRYSPPGVPKPTPSSALEFYGVRIRGLNYEVFHDNPDGTGVKGWHEHIWYPQYGDKYVVRARPTVKGRTLLDLFKWGLKKWNIAVLAEQPKLWPD
jgi:hypothetical protein